MVSSDGGLLLFAMNHSKETLKSIHIVTENIKFETICRPLVKSAYGENLFPAVILKRAVSMGQFF